MSIAPLKKEFGLRYDSADIGKHINKLRLQRNLTMHKLSYKTCVGVAVLTRIEKGENSPVLDTLLKIIDGLDLSIAEFFCGFTEH
jgi:transcriptional regulator with XRE-family HTH domain